MLDIDQLLVPISVTQVSGEDLSFSTEVDSIAHARRHDDPALDQGEWVETLKEADWPYVANHCERLIRLRSKDLRLAVWLAEAHAKTRHFRGLGDGYALLAGLCERFWDSLYPSADGDDHEQRVGNLFWLLARSPQLVKEVPVTEEGDICLADFDAARLRAANPQGPDEWGKSPEPLGPTVEELDARRRRNSADFNVTLLADARYCLASLDALDAAVDQRLGNAGPSFAAAREALQHAIDFIGLLAPADTVETVDSGGAPVAKAARGDGTIASRQQAIDQLRRVADYFRRTEPHSPVAYLADKAASWAGMPLHQWLQAVVKDQGQLAQLNELLGTVASETEG
ncbi:type VI secretion system protein ImpA [Pseudoduganella lurida]|uniref:Type VI secretion system protein ImpA n=1 Tax=Pseudoduganella lurida TaxID=1036180 RepID=A0A562RBL6_9BURK|nr:type VI secretion system protein TssA [Pseudoduganella lurida]TWI66447.1 type VI secretion system protein ImpA [Pseudoduganella lurida]